MQFDYGFRGLERELNLKLFDHVGQGIMLTPAGREPLRRARGLLTDAQALHDQAHLLAVGSSGTPTVGHAAPRKVSRLTDGGRQLGLWLRSSETGVAAGRRQRWPSSW